MIDMHQVAQDIAKRDNQGLGLLILAVATHLCWQELWKIAMEVCDFVHK